MVERGSDVPWMIYGATGFTGRLVAQEAARRGHRPLLAGRSAARLAPLARRLGLECVVADLEDERALAAVVGRVALVLHCAGPFVHTAAPMRRACLHAGASYLDITGELPVVRETFAADAEARARGVALISGVGFDVVPTDCLALHVSRLLPGATALELAIAADTRVTPGTFRSALGLLSGGGWMRRDGELRPCTLGLGARRVPLPDGRVTALPAPLADLETAYRTTGIPNITAYVAVAPAAARLARLAAPLAPRLLASRTFGRLAHRWSPALHAGPGEPVRSGGRARAWARATVGAGDAAEAWLETPEPYRFTASTAVLCAEKALERPLSGALSSAGAFGADLVTEIEGVTLTAREE